MRTMRFGLEKTGRRCHHVKLSYVIFISKEFQREPYGDTTKSDIITRLVMK